MPVSQRRAARRRDEIVDTADHDATGMSLDDILDLAITML
jgi:hypothetical protein